MIPLLSGCFQAATQTTANLGSARTAKSAVKAVVSEATTSGGVFAAVEADSKNEQLISVPTDSAVKGTEVLIPPGALKIAATIFIEESAALATDALSEELSLGTTITDAGTAVAIQSSVAADPAHPLKISLPLPVSGLGLSLQGDPWARLAVIYKVSAFDSAQTFSGVIPRANIVVEGNVAKISTPFFGSFQTALTKDVITEEKKVATTAPIQTKTEVAKLPAMKILGRSPFVAYKGNTIQLSGSNFRPSLVLAMGGRRVANMKVVSDSVVTFQAPEGAGFGLTNLVADQDGVSQSVTLMYGASQTDFPINTAATSDVCIGLKFYDLQGVLREGAKDCSAQIVQAPAGTTPANCSADGQVGCVTTSAFVAVDTANLAPKIAQGQTAGGIAGTAGVRPPDCTAGGATGCVAVSAYPSIDVATIPISQLRTGTSIAGVTGTLANCSSDNQLGCVTVSGYPAIQTSSIIPNTIRFGTTIAGVNGSLANCTNDGSITCVTTTAFPAMQLSGATGMIRAGSTLGGVPGQYPSATFPLAGSDGTPDLDSATFQAKLQDPAFFEWFDSTGLRHQWNGSSVLTMNNIRQGVEIFGVNGAIPTCGTDAQTDCITDTMFPAVNVSALDPYNIRYGQTVGGVFGALTFKTAAADLTRFNLSTGAIAANPSTGVPDYYDSIDDYNNGTALPTGIIQVGSHIAQASDWVPSGGIYRDLISNTYWAPAGNTAMNWLSALDACWNLGTNGMNWRLATDKELMQAYINGINSRRSELVIDPLAYYWTSTSYSPDPTQAMTMKIATGEKFPQDKTYTARYLCIKRY